MPYRLIKTDPTLETALRRIAAEELGAALARLQPSRTAEPAAVHDVRKRVKKLRGLLRMLRPGFDSFEAETAVLRAAALSLSAHRDAEVRRATFERLFPDDCPEPLLALKERLDADRQAPVPDGDARAALAGVAERARHWTLSGRDRDILAEGLFQTRRRARREMARAAAAPDDESFHEWRKRAKDHWYQTRLLTPIWPEVLEPQSADAEKLTEDLGDHHDLGVLAAFAVTTLDADRARPLTDRAASRQREIEARVFPLGRRLFAGDPEATAGLWVSWWKLWRG